jgi:hypothetical protein
MAQRRDGAHPTECAIKRLAETELLRYAHRLLTLREIDRLILTARSPQDLAQAALRNIRQVIPCRGASLVIASPDLGGPCVLAVDSDRPTTLGPGAHVSCKHPKASECYFDVRPHLVPISRCWVSRRRLSTLCMLRTYSARLRWHSW